MGEMEQTEDNRKTSTAWERAESLPSPLAASAGAPAASAGIVAFGRDELREIFDLYGRKVCDGEWRDYAIDFTPQKAVFSIYRRACEYPLYRIEKTPRLSRKQGAYAIVAATGVVLKREHDLGRVLAVLGRRLKLVSG